MKSYRRLAIAVTLGALSAGRPLQAQPTPAEGLRQNTPRVHAFINARIVQAPGRVLEKGTLVIRDGVISAVGSASPPRDARIWDLNGMTVYPGLVDAYSDYGMPKPQQTGETRGGTQQVAESRGPAHWNEGVQAQQDASELFSPDAKTAEKLRSQGLTSALIVPPRGIFRGTSALVSLGEGKPGDLILRTGCAQHVTLDFERGRAGYPNSLMGLIALVRQTLLDAAWYQKALEAHRRNPALERPALSPPLEALKEAAAGKAPLIIETSDELDFLRAQEIAREFNLTILIRGSGYEYRRLDEVKKAGRDLILPVNFPDVPAVQTQEEALQLSLAELRHWDEAPENPKRLARAGIRLAFTGALLTDKGTYLAQIRRAVLRGLSPDTALAAMTTHPAAMFGVSNMLGSIEAGKVANFLITTGDLFSDKTLIREVWIDGRRYEVTARPETDVRGAWELTIADRETTHLLSLKLTGEPDALRGSVRKGRDIRLTSATVSAGRLMLSFPGDSLGYQGSARLTLLVEPGALRGSGTWPDGKMFTCVGTRSAPYSPEPDTAKAKSVAPALFPALYPAGEFGRSSLPEQPASVLVRNATVWTSGPQGILKECDILFERGKVKKLGRNLEAPPGAVLVDGSGKHVTAGLIDAHAHIAIDGNANEGSRAVTSEVRVSDVLDPNDINIYRALAGGLTTSHTMHGSANPIGGLCQIIKLRWGMTPAGLKFENAPPTLKLALGENVKQANFTGQGPRRYPSTRMGVEQVLRDEFQAALEYEKEWKQFDDKKGGIPPRRNLELEATLDLLRGRSVARVHAYRQDEILMVMRVASDFGFRIQAIEHGLEGYKVADVLARQKTGAATFSDWWGFKLEVYDAIPYNAKLMQDQGVVVALKSDSDELCRRLNWEAAKGVKYGGMTEEEALRLVTINPAILLGIDSRVGSLEPGKDADFVVWNGNPLSIYTLCEQTWVDGRRYFDRDEDRALYQEAERERAVLVQKALQAKPRAGGSTREEGSGRGTRGVPGQFLNGEEDDQ